MDISKYVLMQKMTHEKTWSDIFTPFVPKVHFDNKADFINRKLNSGEWFSLSSVQSRDFHVNFILLYIISLRGQSLVKVQDSLFILTDIWMI